MNDEKKIFKFKGIIERCVYKSETFSVYAINVDIKKYPDIQLNKYKNCTITGELGDLIADVEYEIEAIETDTKYGKSYKVHNIRRDTPTNKEETYLFLKEILTTNQAETLVENYPNIIQLVKDNRISEVNVGKLKGIGEKTLLKIKDKIINDLYLMDLVVEFGNILSLNMLKKIYDEYESVDILKKKLSNYPYTTLTMISGVGFKKADAMILEMQKEKIINFNIDDVRTSADRCLACTLYLLSENEKGGNTRANLIDIRTQCLKLVPEAIDHFAEIIKNDNIYYNKTDLHIALMRTYKTEEYIANAIKYGLSINRKWDFDWKSYQNKSDVSLSDEQIELLHAVCDNNIVILTGGAGMGKSKSTEMLIEMLNDGGKSYRLMTPTGKSAKVLKDFSGVETNTIHRGLMYNPKLGWGYNKDNKLLCDIVLIDEISMVSIELMAHVIDAIDFNKTKLVMIGDHNQLPSVQCGNILHDFLSSNIIPTVRLTKVFRYGTGGILTVATDIIKGKQYIPNDNKKMFSVGEDNGYTFIKSDDNSIIQNVLALYKKLITVGIDDCVYKPEDIAVLTAYNKGDYGAVSLNKHLQRIANANYGSENNFKYGDSVYYLNDIVMQRANDYSMKIYNKELSECDDEEEAFVANGECSKISLINKDFMVCDFDNMRIKYNKESLSNLSLSYCYTTHKSQGSTVKVVIVVTPRSHIYMNTMNLLYVGVTRASDKCFHFGLPSTINIALKKKENYNRNTFMKEMLIVQ